MQGKERSVQVVCINECGQTFFGDRMVEWQLQDPPDLLRRYSSCISRRVRDKPGLCCC